MVILLSFYAGAVVGFALGVIILAIFTVGKRGDRAMEEWRGES